jgi:hypothetical protein
LSTVLSACANIQTIDAQSQPTDLSEPTVQIKATELPEASEESATETLVPTETELTSTTLTWENGIKQIFEYRCFDCHGTNPTNGFLVSSYTRVMQGGINGAIIIPGNPEESHIFIKLTISSSHPGYMSGDEMNIVREWISNGAPEN